MRRTGIALLGALLAVARPAAAFELARAADGAPLQGVALPVHLRVLIDDALVDEADQGALGARAAAWHAALQWEAPSPSALHFRRWLAGEPEPVDAAARVSVRALTSDWPAEYGSPLATIAFAVVRVDEAARRIAEAEILLNAQGFAYSTSEQPRRLDLEGTLSHELGHAVGLEHSCGESWGQYPDCLQLPADVRASVEEATMFPAASAGNTWQRDLARDDVDGLTALYGDGSALAPPWMAVACGCQDQARVLRIDADLAASQVELFVGDDRHALPLSPAACAGDHAVCRRSAVIPEAVDAAFDVELTDPVSGKRAAVFDRQCPPCSAAPPPADAGPGCHCGLATGMALSLPWWRVRRRQPCGRA